jgi:hypothetical protein
MPSIKCEWIRIPTEKGASFTEIDNGRTLTEALEFTPVPWDDLDRSVYVIRLNSDLIIEYPSGTSPVLYIGEGNISSRISHHRKQWLSEFAGEQRDFKYSIWFCVPRVKNNIDAYKSVEAHLIRMFIEIYGALPMFNRHKENEIYKYDYESSFYKVFSVGQGRRPKWSIKPLRSHPSYERYVRG